MPHPVLPSPARREGPGLLFMVPLAVTALGTKENKTSGVDPGASAVSQQLSLLRGDEGMR